MAIFNPATAAVAALAVLPQSDLRDEKDATYFYYGWESVNGGWLIQRQLRSQGTSESATTGHADLSAAWPNRTTLGYS